MIELTSLTPIEMFFFSFMTYCIGKYCPKKYLVSENTQFLIEILNTLIPGFFMVFISMIVFANLSVSHLVFILVSYIIVDICGIIVLPNAGYFIYEIFRIVAYFLTLCFPLLILELTSIFLLILGSILVFSMLRMVI